LRIWIFLYSRILTFKECLNHYSLYASRLLQNVNSVLCRKVQTPLPLLQFQTKMEFRIEYVQSIEEFRAFVGIFRYFYRHFVGESKNKGRKVSIIFFFKISNFDTHIFTLIRDTYYRLLSAKFFFLLCKVFIKISNT